MKAAATSGGAPDGAAPAGASTATEPPAEPANVDPSWFGEKSVTIASKDGLVIARGSVNVQARPSGVARSARYDYKESRKAAMRLQAVHRGKRHRMKAQYEKETKAKKEKIAQASPNLRVRRSSNTPSPESLRRRRNSNTPSPERAADGRGSPTSPTSPESSPPGTRSGPGPSVVPALAIAGSAGSSPSSNRSTTPQGRRGSVFSGISA